MKTKKQDLIDLRKELASKKKTYSFSSFNKKLVQKNYKKIQY